MVLNERGKYGSRSAVSTLATTTAMCQADGVDQLRCAHCQQIIGAYEPMILRASGATHHGSRLTLTSHLTQADSIPLHANCHPGPRTPNP